MDELSQLTHQGGIGVIFVYILQYLKNSTHFPWLTQNTPRLNRWVGMVIALGTSLGVKYAATAASGGGYHVVLDIPNLQALGDALIHAAAQFAGQQVLYHTAVKAVSVDQPAQPAVLDHNLPAMPPHAGLGGGQ